MSKIKFLTCITLICLLSSQVFAQASQDEKTSILYLVGFRAGEVALKELSTPKESPNPLVLTDAGYMVAIGEYSTEKALDGVMLATGASEGKGNLVRVHRPYNSPLWFAFFNNLTKECIYLEANKSLLELWLKKEANGKANYTEFMELDLREIFSKVSKVNIDPEVLMTEEGAKAWHHNFVDKTFGGNEFSIITISAVWSYGISHELLKAAEFHNHICPGLTSGYYIAKYLRSNYPLDKGEKLVIWAIPPWCKDDALQQVFDATVGKRQMAVMYLSEDIKNKLYPQYKNIAGVYVKINKKGEAKAIVLGWDWNKACKDCGIKRADFKNFSSYKWWWARLIADVMLMKHKPEEYISVLKVVDLGNQGSIKTMNANLVHVGANPLEILGLMPEEEEKYIESTPKWVYPTLLILICITAISLGLALKKKQQ